MQALKKSIMSYAASSIRTAAPCNLLTFGISINAGSKTSSNASTSTKMLPLSFLALLLIVSHKKGPSVGLAAQRKSRND